MSYKTTLLISLSIFFLLIIGIYFLMIYNTGIGLCALLSLYTGMFMQILFRKEDKIDDNKHTKNSV